MMRVKGESAVAGAEEGESEEIAAAASIEGVEVSSSPWMAGAESMRVGVVVATAAIVGVLAVGRSSGQRCKV